MLIYALKSHFKYVKRKRKKIVKTGSALASLASGEGVAWRRRTVQRKQEPFF